MRRYSNSPSTAVTPPTAQSPQPMSAAQCALIERLGAYSLDAPDVALPYSVRLAQREGWSSDHTAEVIAEYKRFAFLAVSTGQVATPSKAVDAAWHLHLEYTREYWDVFCAQVLGAPLHHTPGNGAPGEAEAYARAYAHTLDDYRRLFGTEPPVAVWPRLPSRADAAPGEEPGDATSPATRAARTAHRKQKAHTAARLTRRWRAFRERRLPLAGLAWLTAAVATCAYAGDFTPLDVDVLNYAGRDFLRFYLALCFGVLLLIYWAHKFEHRRRAWGVHGAPTLIRAMTPDQAAFLTGGAQRMARVATLALIEAGAISLSPYPSRKPSVKAENIAMAGRYASAWQWLRAKKDGRADYVAFRAQLMLQEKSFDAELIESGWLWKRGGMRGLLFVARVLALCVAVLGLAKICVGMSRDRPVMLLVIGVILFALAYVIVMRRLPGLGRSGPTRGGRQALAECGARYAVAWSLSGQQGQEGQQGRRNQRGQSRGQSASTDEGLADALLWRTALLGVGALSGTAWATYGRALNVPAVVASSGTGGGIDSSNCSSSSCSSSSCSSCSSSSCGGCSNN